MHLVLENPDFDYVLRGADGHQAHVNQQVLRASFLLTPHRLVEAWPVTRVTDLDLDTLKPILDLQPELVLLGCGERQQFPSAQVQAACLSAGIGLEVMTNAAAARTFNVLAAEGRKVVAAFVLGA